MRKRSNSPCTFVYRFPHKYPTSIVITLPPLRNMMCTGTDILYPKAKLFSRLTAKNMTILGTHRISGTFLGLRKNGGCLIEKWAGHVKRATRTNCVKVMRRPGECVSGLQERTVVDRIYHCQIHPCKA